MKTRNRRRVFAAAAVAIAFLLVNAAIALFGLHREPSGAFYKDPFAVALELAPGASIPFAEFDRVNNYGFRGGDVATRKPPGTWRLVSIGDSSTFGSGVAARETYTHRLGEKLAALGPWEAINAGVPGTAIVQHRILFDARLRDLSPDIVLVYVSANVADEFEVVRDALDREGAWAPDAPSAARRIIRRVPVYAALRRALRGPMTRRMKTHIEQALEMSGGENRNARIAQGLARDLAGLGAAIRRAGARPVWSIIASSHPLEPLANLDRPPTRHDLLAALPFLGALFAYAGEHGDPVVDPYPSLVSARKNGEDLLQDFVHPTARGHEILAEAMAPVVLGEAERIMRGGGEHAPAVVTAEPSP
ncbi:hypothetical protein K8I61_17735 [bacterium]|nr:hypothetical protein [bacterium]